MKKLLWLFLVFSISWPVYSDGAVGSAAVDTWYVRPSTECSNNGDGLSYACAASAGAAGAFNSLTSVIWTATDGVDDGDTLCISGTHRQTMSGIGGVGTTSAPITVKLDCAGIPAGVISGADIVTAWDTLDGNGNQVTSGTFSEPMFLLVDGIAAHHGSSVGSLAPGEWYYISGSTKVAYHGSVAGHTMEIPTRSSAIFASGGVENMIVTGGRFEAILSSPATGTFMFRGCANILITNVTVYAVATGVDFQGTCKNVSVTNSTFTYCADCLDTNINAANKPSNVTFQNNSVSGLYANADGTNWIGNYDAIIGGGRIYDHECIASTSAGNYITSAYNDISHCRTGIFNLPNTDVVGYLAIGNYIHDIYDDAIEFTCASGCAISGSAISGNLIYNGGQEASGLSSNAINAGGSTVAGASIDITQNTIAKWANGIFMTGGGLTHNNGKIVNNIIADLFCAGCFGDYLNTDTWAEQSTSVINNNIYYRTSGIYKIPRWDTNGFAATSTFSTHQSNLSPNESASLNADPLFINSTTDFRTAASSPSRRAGTGGYVCSERRGRACYSDRPDIGAYQATSGDPAAPRTAR